MSGTEAGVLAGAKRKRESSKRELKSKSRRKSPSAESNPQTDIVQLEAQILESRQHYNNIATLLQLARQSETKDEAPILAAVALCRVFSRLMAGGDMMKSKGIGEAEMVVMSWLKERYRDFVNLLLRDFLRSEHAPKQSVALTLLMRMIKEESKAQKDYRIKNGLLPRLVEELLLLPEDDPNRGEFAEKYLKEYDDVKYQTLKSITITLESDLDLSTRRLVTANALSLLSTLDKIPTKSSEISTPYATASSLPNLTTLKTAAQSAYLSTLRSPLTAPQLKTVLSTLPHAIAPWFTQPELLMDFLSDSFAQGGATALLALSGLYYLITTRNLDYPSFYTKLYALLDEDVLHSKHRSKFFRMLDTFMSSTHLPAALVASFIKRLCRLALHAPPAGVVVVVPWVYNMFQRHPACTFMMHREISSSTLQQQIEDEGMHDRFNMAEPDPMATGGIDSCVWELEALQRHWHPNVATLARIISEQFTKRSYNLEDFLDYSYASLLDVELDRELKKDPEVEFEIPKHIFTAEEGLGTLGVLMTQVLECR